MSQEITEAPDTPTKAMAAAPSKIVVQQRVEEILSIRLDGAQFWDVESYIRQAEAKGEPPWQVPEGATPLSARTIWRYMEKANALWRKACEENRDKLLFRHLAQRKHIYTKAVAAGDYRTALAAVRDEAELLSLYPPKQSVRLSNHVLTLNIKEEVITPPKVIDAQPALAIEDKGMCHNDTSLPTPSEREGQNLPLPDKSSCQNDNLIPTKAIHESSTSNGTGENNQATPCPAGVPEK